MSKISLIERYRNAVRRVCYLHRGVRDAAVILEGLACNDIQAVADVIHCSLTHGTPPKLNELIDSFYTSRHAPNEKKLYLSAARLLPSERSVCTSGLSAAAVLRKLRYSNQLIPAVLKLRYQIKCGVDSR